MVDFSGNATQIAPLQNAVRPEQGVAAPPSIFGGAARVLEQVGGIFEDRKQEARTDYLRQYSQEQNDVIMALEQGAGGIRTMAQARTVIRRNLQAALAAGVVPVDELLDAHNGILGAIGNKQLLSDGTISEQRRNDAIDRLQADGALGLNPTDQQVQSALSNEQTQASAQQMYTSRMNEIRLQEAEAGLTASGREDVQRQRSAAARTLLQTTAPQRLAEIGTRASQILSGEGSRAEKATAIEGLFISFQGELTGLIGDATSSEMASYMEPFNSLKQTLLGVASGERELAGIQTDIDLAVKVQEGILASTPRVAQLSAASNLLGEGVVKDYLAGSPQTLSTLLEFVAEGDPGTGNEGTGGQGFNPFTAEDASIESMDIYLKGVLSMLNSSDTSVSQEGGRRITSLLGSIEDYQGMIKRNPESAIAIARMFASPEFSGMISRNPELINTIGPAAAEVMDNYYFNEVWGMVSTEFRNKNVEIVLGPDQQALDSAAAGEMPEGGWEALAGGGTSQSPVPSLVGVRPVSTGMEFYPLADRGSPEYAESVTLAREMNSPNNGLASVINTSLRASANLMGRSDYGVLWEETAQHILSGGATTDVGDDLEMDNFQPNVQTISGVTDAGAGFTTVVSPNGGVVRREGARNWRNHNPGNIEDGSFARSNGAIGTDGRFAVFPDYETGRKAKSKLIFETSSYRNLSLTAAIHRYAPPSDNNNTEAYISGIVQAAGVTRNTKMSDMTPQQREAVLDAMQEIEGWAVGSETVIN